MYLSPRTSSLGDQEQLRENKVHLGRSLHARTKLLTLWGRQFIGQNDTLTTRLASDHASIGTGELKLAEKVYRARNTQRRERENDWGRNGNGFMVGHCSHVGWGM